MSVGRQELMVDCGLLPSTVSAFAMLGKASRLRQARLACLGPNIMKLSITHVRSASYCI